MSILGNKKKEIKDYKKLDGDIQIGDSVDINFLGHVYENFIVVDGQKNDFDSMTYLCKHRFTKEYPRGMVEYYHKDYVKKRK